MGKHDELAHFLHTPKQLKFKQTKPTVRDVTNIQQRAQKLGELNRRG